MIVITATIQVHAEGRAKAFEAALAMAEETRKEAGCLSYTFYSALAEPDTFFVFEEWESDEAIGSHFESAHMKAFRGKLPGLVAGAPKVVRYEIANHGALA